MNRLIIPLQDQQNINYFLAAFCLIIFIFCMTPFAGGWKTGFYLIFGIYNFLCFTEHILLALSRYSFFSISAYQFTSAFITHANLLNQTLIFAFILFYFAFSKPWEKLAVFAFSVTILQNALILLKLYEYIYIVNIISGLAALMLLLSVQYNKRPDKKLLLTGLLSNIGASFYSCLNYPSYNINFINTLTFFLLKIIFIGCFTAAIAIRIIRRHRQLENKNNLQLSGGKFTANSASINHIIYRYNGEKRRLPLSGILFFRADRVIIEIHTLKNETFLIEKPLNTLEKELPANFLRVHRSYIVNLDYVESFKHKGGGSYMLSLDQGQILPVSRSRYETLQKRLAAH
jgi:hypothetical protein